MPHTVTHWAGTNWAGNVEFRPRGFATPASVEELRDVVANARAVRALGTGHSFNRVADCDDVIVSLAGLPPRVEIDDGAATATVSPGLRYGEVGARLHAAGFALANLGSLPHIGIAGACATATHGSGVANRNLASAVRALDVVTADAEVVSFARDADEDFAGAIVSLGALGIVVSMTLDLVPTFEVRQYVYDDVPGAQVRANFDEIVASAYSVSVFTDWGAADVHQIWRKHRDDDAVEPAERWMGGVLASSDRHPVPGMPASNCTPQQGVPGPWHERLPHFRLEFTPSSGDELQSEYLLPREHAAAAFDALGSIRSLISPVLQICEVRVIAADDLWLSPCYRRDAVAFHFTWVKNAATVLPVVSEVERRLASFDARPHWGKVFTTAPDSLRQSYERYADFEKLIGRHDPAGKFRNEFVDRLFSRPKSAGRGRHAAQ